MIVADSSVWIDYFRNLSTAQTEYLHKLFGREALVIGDLILTEVLQGTDTDRDFARTREVLMEFEIIEIAGQDVAIEAARNFRKLRALGITVRKTIDTLIATRCIVDGHSLLFSDRDFQPFVHHLGLASALHA